MRLLIDGQGDFLVENRDVLRAGLRTAAWITVDDTGACHADWQRPLHLVHLTGQQEPIELIGSSLFGVG
jgi:hypothetical protein